MVIVYFENEQERYSEVAAKFESEEVYFACLPALERKAKENGFDFVSEAISDDEL